VERDRRAAAVPGGAAIPVPNHFTHPTKSKQTKEPTVKTIRIAVLGTAAVVAATLLTACGDDDHDCDATSAVTPALQTDTRTGEQLVAVAAPGRSTGGTGGRGPAPRPATTGGGGAHGHVDLDDDCDD
jgi:hypothetical protein